MLLQANNHHSKHLHIIIRAFSWGTDSSLNCPDEWYEWSAKYVCSLAELACYADDSIHHIRYQIPLFDQSEWNIDFKTSTSDWVNAAPTLLRNLSPWRNFSMWSRDHAVCSLWFSTSKNRELYCVSGQSSPSPPVWSLARVWLMLPKVLINQGWSASAHRIVKNPIQTASTLSAAFPSLSVVFKHHHYEIPITSNCF